ncbi:MAG: FAD-dependent oxidoreductase [Terriglobales bacterium]|jgi:glycine/D-amino acid oxidase-like deaminating enzyme
MQLGECSDGRILVRSTLEEAACDKRVDPAVIQRLHAAAIALVRAIAAAAILKCWAGLRPGTPDEMPIQGQTVLKGYFVATGHYRAGVLVAPIASILMA